MLTTRDPSIGGRIVIAIGTAALLQATGCLAENNEAASQETWAETAQASLNQIPNKLTTNALTTNALTTNALTTNALLSTALSTAEIAATKDISDALDSDPDAREVFKYIVSCALSTGSSVTVSGINYPGALGVAPEWEFAALTISGRYRVSACILARVNKFGISVPISMRADFLPSADPVVEEPGYAYFEGAFWGDIFDKKAKMFTCGNFYYPLDGLRQCTHDCGFDTVGDCSTLGGPGSYPNGVGIPGSNGYPVSIFLQPDTGAGTCGDGICDSGARETATAKKACNLDCGYIYW